MLPAASPPKRLPWMAVVHAPLFGRLPLVVVSVTSLFALSLTDLLHHILPDQTSFRSHRVKQLLKRHILVSLASHRLGRSLKSLQHIGGRARQAARAPPFVAHCPSWEIDVVARGAHP